MPVSSIAQRLVRQIFCTRIQSCEKSNSQLTNVKIAFVNYPFSDVKRPSLGLTILKGIIQRHFPEIPTELKYLNVEFCDRYGYQNYQRLLELPNHLLAGDWVFSPLLYGQSIEHDAQYESHIEDVFNRLGLIVPDDCGELLYRSRAIAHDFHHEMLSKIDWGEFALVGFSSMFQQHVGSLAFAKAIKENFPHVKIAFGGANCEGDMGRETFAAFDFVDYVCDGEGEAVIRDIVQELRNGESDRRHLSASVPVRLDESPFPDYDDFFDQIGTTGLAAEIDAFAIPFETSRGCWWGKKHHCTFCGLNGGTMEFRSKSADRALQELSWLWTKYRTKKPLLYAVDNIMPSSYRRSVLPELSVLGALFFYETKSNLKRSDLVLFKEAGIEVFQPGIEQFSTRLLRLIDKGVSGLHNVRLLRDCASEKVTPIWNLLVRIPGETEGDYDFLCDLVERIPHLRPPTGGILVDIGIIRFSPYFERAEEYGVDNVRPFKAYQLIHWPMRQSTVANLAYFFEYDRHAPSGLELKIEQLAEKVESWSVGYDDAYLFQVKVNDSLYVFDFRSRENEHIYRLDFPFSDIFYKLQEPAEQGNFVRHCLIEYGLESAEILEFISEMDDLRLIIGEDGKIMSLPADAHNIDALPASLQARASNQLTENVDAR